MAKKRPKINLTPTPPAHRGDLEKLFSGEEDVEQASGLQLLAVRLDAINADPEQPRRTFDDESLVELSESIRQDGVIQPIEVTELGPDSYMIVHGERRWRAARLAGLITIPAVVRRRDYDDLTRFVRQLVENIQREDLNDVDRASGLLRLRDLMREELAAAAPPQDGEKVPPWARKVTWAKVGERLGYSRQRIHQLVKLLDLHEDLREAVRQGQLSERDSRPYQKLAAEQQQALYQASRQNDLSAGEVKRIARRWEQTPEVPVTEVISAVRRTAAPPAVQTTTRPAQLQLVLGRITWAYQHLMETEFDRLSVEKRPEVVARLQELRQLLDSLIETLGENGQ